MRFQFPFAAVHTTLDLDPDLDVRGLSPRHFETRRLDNGRARNFVAEGAIASPRIDTLYLRFGIEDSCACLRTSREIARNPETEEILGEVFGDLVPQRIVFRRQ